MNLVTWVKVGTRAECTAALRGQPIVGRPRWGRHGDHWHVEWDVAA